MVGREQVSLTLLFHLLFSVADFRSFSSLLHPLSSSLMFADSAAQECELLRKVFQNVVTDPEAEVSSSLPSLCVLIEGEAGIGNCLLLAPCYLLLATFEHVNLPLTCSLLRLR